MIFYLPVALCISENLKNQVILFFSPSKHNLLSYLNCEFKNHLNKK